MIRTLSHGTGARKSGIPSTLACGSGGLLRPPPLATFLLYTPPVTRRQAARLGVFESPTSHRSACGVPALRRSRAGVSRVDGNSAREGLDSDGPQIVRG